MTKLINMLNIRNNTLCMVVEVHLRYIAPVANLEVKDCLGDFHEHVNQIRCLLSTMQFFFESHNLYETTQSQLGITFALPSLDIVTRQSLTFTII